MNRNIKVYLLVGTAVLIFIASVVVIIGAALYFHIFRIASSVTGGG